MNTLNLKLAQRASKDPALMASLIDQYSETMNLRWEDVANQLWIDNYRLAKLALCRRPRRAKFSDDVAQVSHFVGVDSERLTGFIQHAEGLKEEQPAVNKKKSVQKNTARVPERALNRGLVWAFAAALLVLIFLGAFVLLQPNTAAATVVTRRGDVTILKSEKSMSIIPGSREKNLEAGKATAVATGDMVRVGQNGYAQLQLPDGSTIDLFANSELEVANLNITEDSFQVRLKLMAGGALNRVKRLLDPGDFFEVITPSSTVSVRGTVFTVQVISPEITYVSVEEGIVEVRMNEQVAMVEAGEEVTAMVGRPMDVQPQTDLNDPDGGVQLTPTPDLLSATPTVEGTPTPTGTVTGLGSDPDDSDSDDPSGSNVDPNQDDPDDPDDPVIENPPPGLGGTIPGDGGEPPGQGTPPGHQEDVNPSKDK
jgi:ferric-dicitrate binding protein FerR (iron transport regulator)